MTLGDRRVFDPSAPPEERPAPALRRPLQPFTTAFIVVCVAVAAIDFLLGNRIVDAGHLYGPFVTQGQWWRVLTTAILHAGPIHLLMNMMATYDLGGQLERGIGTWRIALISLITAFGAASMVLLFSYSRETVGASGVICGYVGAMLPIATHEGRRILTSLVIQITIISLLPFVSWQGHLGGFVFGLMCGGALRFAGKKFLVPGLLLLAFAIAATLVAAKLGGALAPAPRGFVP